MLSKPLGKNHLLKNVNFVLGQCQSSKVLLLTSIQHRQSEFTPSDDTENRNDVAQSLCGSQLAILRFAAWFQYFVKQFNLPPHGIPVELLNGLLECRDSQICHELSLNGFASLGRLNFCGMQHDDGQTGVWFLLADWR